MIRKVYLGLLKKCKFIDAEQYVKIYYEYYFRKKLDLQNPITFNEKIQWLKVFYRPKILNLLVDKYEVRNYVSKKVGDKFLSEVIQVADSSDQINFDDLPNRFVVKATHGCNFNLVVFDKKKLNFIKAKLRFNKWLSKNQYYRGGLEWAYKDIRPRLIVEGYMEESGKASLTDFKFYCFNGKPHYIQVDTDRGGKHCRHFYDLHWVLQPFTKGRFEVAKNTLPKPMGLSTMIENVEKLSHGFPFVRVDLYNIDGKIIFGEMTFYPGDGRQPFNPSEYDEKIGRMLRLPKIPKGKKYITEPFL